MGKKIIFFDTETTGNTANDFLCQIAYKTEDEEFGELYKPLIKIPPEASAVHHITNKMVDQKPTFSESQDFEKIKKLFEDENSVAVAHNAIFDLTMLKKENIIPKNYICTLKIARYLDPDAKLGKYNLQYLRYALDIDIEATAHDAMGDVLVLQKLFERLMKKFMESYNLNEDETLQKMIEISSKPFLFKNINFGKYNGRSISEIAEIDRGYLEWLLAEKTKGDQMDEDWIYTLKQALGK